MLAVRILQIVSGLCWLIPFAIHWPAAVRVLLKRTRPSDPLRAVLWFMAASQIGFISRWLLFPKAVSLMRDDELTLWAGMYVLSSLCALAVAWVVTAEARIR